MATATGRPLAAGLAATLSHNWWVLLLRGMVAILFGIVTFAQPGITLAALVIWFGAFAFVEGMLTSFMAITHRHDKENWGLLLLSGFVGIGAGIVTWAEPGMTALVLLLYIAIWAIAKGVLLLTAAIRLRKEIEGEWLLGLAGVVAVVFGIAIMVQPARGALAVLWLIAAFAIVYGVALAALSFRMRAAGHRLEARLA